MANDNFIPILAPLYEISPQTYLISREFVYNGKLIINRHIEKMSFLYVSSDNFSYFESNVEEIILPEGLKEFWVYLGGGTHIKSSREYLDIELPKLRNIKFPKSIEYISPGIFKGTKVFEEPLWRHESREVFWLKNTATEQSVYLNRQSRLILVDEHTVPVDKIKSIIYKTNGEMVFSYENEDVLDDFPDQVKSSWWSGERVGELWIRTTMPGQSGSVGFRSITESYAKKTCRAILSLIRTSRESHQISNDEKIATYCRHCGKAIPNDSSFCKYCGKGQ